MAHFGIPEVRAFSVGRSRTSYHLLDVGLIVAQYSFERVRAGYRDLWSRMKVLKVESASRQARQIIANKTRYQGIERATGVPWFVIGCLHMRESNGNFNTYLGNGQPLNRKTTIVPKGRGPWRSFEAGAFDALVTVEHLDQIRNWGPEHVAYAAEKFNGFGYRHPSRNIPSPYLWGGTTVQKRGKFVRDGVYDPSVMDPQIGAMAVLKQIMALDPSARFIDRPILPDPEDIEDDEEEDTPSPPARDTEGQTKPMSRSKTIWGAITQFLSSGGAAVLAFIQGMPPWLIALLVVAATVGLYLVIKGRIDAQKVIKHLSEDEAA
jgi:lysozyme family protein